MQQNPVGQPGQAVIVGTAQQRFLLAFSFGNVTESSHQKAFIRELHLAKRQLHLNLVPDLVHHLCINVQPVDRAQSTAHVPLHTLAVGLLKALRLQYRNIQTDEFLGLVTKHIHYGRIGKGYDVGHVNDDDRFA